MPQSSAPSAGKSVGSLGVVETVGVVAAAEAMDAMVKAAQVEIVKYERTGGGRVAAFVRGEIAAVRVAVEAGAAAATPLGITASLVVPNPDAKLAAILGL